MNIIRMDSLVRCGISGLAISCLFTMVFCNWQEFEGHYYIYLGRNVQVQYADATQMCQDLNGSWVVTVTTPEENAFVRSFDTLTSIYLWMGYDDIEDEGNWIWADGSIGTSYTNWIRYTANTEDIDCAMMTGNGLWKYEYCSGWRYVVCEAGDIDECAESTDGCMNKATCVNTPDSYYCSCRAGFSDEKCDKGSSKMKAVTNAKNEQVCINTKKLTELTVAKKRLRSLMECFQYCVAVEHCNANTSSNAFQIQKTTAAGVMCHLVEYNGDLSKCVKARDCNLYIMNTA